MEPEILTALGWEAWLTLATRAAVFLAAAFTRWSTDVVFFGGTGLLLVTGVLKPAEALGGFSSSCVAVVGVLYIVVSGLQETGALRGEFVVIVEGPKERAAEHTLTAVETMRVLTRHLPPTQAARIGAELLSMSRRELYQLADSSAEDKPES